MYHSNHINSMQQPQGIEMVPGTTDHRTILDTLSHPMQSPIKTLQTFFGIAILASSCSLPITTSLLFAAELFNQGAMIRTKVDEQLTAATGTFVAIAGYLFGKVTKGLDSEQKPGKEGTT